MTVYYLHTLDDKPAAFDPVTETIYFISKYGKAPALTASLQKIYREQRLDRKNNPRTHSDFKYGYRRVAVPDGDRPR